MRRPLSQHRQLAGGGTRAGVGSTAQRQQRDEDARAKGRGQRADAQVKCLVPVWVESLLYCCRGECLSSVDCDDCEWVREGELAAAAAEIGSAHHAEDDEGLSTARVEGSGGDVAEHVGTHCQQAVQCVSPSLSSDWARSLARLGSTHDIALDEGIGSDNRQTDAARANEQEHGMCANEMVQ